MQQDKLSRFYLKFSSYVIFFEENLDLARGSAMDGTLSLNKILFHSLKFVTMSTLTYCLHSDSK